MAEFVGFQPVTFDASMQLNNSTNYWNANPKRKKCRIGFFNKTPLELMDLIITT